MEQERIVRTFSAWDYVVFGIMLGISALIGIFYAIKDRNKNIDTEEYLMAGRSLGVVPVALSLTVSFMSAITVLGTPSEVYLYGTMYWWTLLAMLLVVGIVVLIYIPVFYNLGISSTYEYLELRFNRQVRILGTVIFILETTLYIGIVIYAPALAFNQVTGFSLWGSVMATGIVCTFYTTLGGLKAVIWTDVFQSIIMCGGFVAIIIKGSVDLGGFGNIWRICEEGDRIDFVHFETDVHIRHTFWTFMLGATILWLGIYAVSQSQVQRYLCCKSEKTAKLALVVNWFGLCVIISLACMCGLVLYAYYKDCDPLGKECVKASDQLLPFMVMEMFVDYPGIPGLFVACVYSGSLSTVSSGINSMATVTIEDLIKPFTVYSANTYGWLSKGAVIFYGGISLGVAYIASQLGGVLEAALSILGMVGGPLVGLFTLALFFPFANSPGAFVGTVVGLSFSTWVYIGSKQYPAGNEYIRRLPLETECDATCFVNKTTAYNTTTIEQTTTTFFTTTPFLNTTAAEDPAIANLYQVSYLYLSVLGFSGVLGVGLIVSLITCGWRDRRKVEPRLITHFFDLVIFRWLPLSFRKFMRCGVEEENKQIHCFDDVMNSKPPEADSIKRINSDHVSVSPSYTGGKTNHAYDVGVDIVKFNPNSNRSNETTSL